MRRAESNDAAKIRGLQWQAEQARIQADRDAKAARDRAVTDAAAVAQQVEHVSYAEQVRRQRLGVVIAPATFGRAAAAHVGRIQAATGTFLAECRAISAQATALQAICDGIAAKRGVSLRGIRA
jgi:hypothetical protein